MHILQINDRLPDIRIERTIHSDIRLGHKVSFIGLDVKDPKDVPNVHTLNMSLRDTLFRMKKFQTALKKLVKQIDPDVIHAHNIFLARAALDLGYPLVYNDHEYWSKDMLANNPFALPWTKEFLKKKVTWVYRYLKISSWEKQVLSKSVVIVTHENVAKEHRKRCKWVFVIPNMPERREVENIWSPALKSKREFDATYIGNDFTRKSYPFRQSYQAFSILHKKGVKMIVIGDRKLKSDEFVRSVGYVPHDEMYKYTIQAKTGLIPWNPHPCLQYKDSNKFYIYMHSGAFPIIPYFMKPQHDEFCLRFKKVHEIPALIEQAKRQDNVKEIIEYAKKYHLWEYYEERLKQAYEVVTS